MGWAGACFAWLGEDLRGGCCRLRVAVAGLGFSWAAVDEWEANFDELRPSLDVGDGSLVAGDGLPIAGDRLLIAGD